MHITSFVVALILYVNLLAFEGTQGLSFVAAINDDFITEETAELTEIKNHTNIPKYDCDCGKASSGCEMLNGQKLCTCYDGYAQDVDGTCKKCRCGVWSQDCKFSSTGEKMCFCDIGYQPKEGKCTECSCGSKGTCSFNGTSKICECNSGYQDANGFCRICDCGANGKCIFENVSGFLRKECLCQDGYSEYAGFCKSCFCGDKGNCTFNHTKEKVCNCEYGFGQNSGICRICGCDPESKCTFDTTTKKCQCPKGYEDVQGVCKDINECLQIDICPKTSNCVNLLGSYNCTCKEGYEEPSSNFNPKVDECKDIDECTTIEIPCIHTDSTVCVNIPGSYRCDCKKGFQPPFDYLYLNKPPEKRYCIQDLKSNNSLAIFIGSLCGVVVFIVLMYLYRLRRRQ